MTLWMPIAIDAEPGLFGLALEPIMNRQIDDICIMESRNRRIEALRSPVRGIQKGSELCAFDM